MRLSDWSISPSRPIRTSGRRHGLATLNLTDNSASRSRRIKGSGTVERAERRRASRRNPGEAAFYLKRLRSAALCHITARTQHTTATFNSQNGRSLRRRPRPQQGPRRLHRQGRQHQLHDGLAAPRQQVSSGPSHLAAIPGFFSIPRRSPPRDRARRDPILVCGVKQSSCDPSHARFIGAPPPSILAVIPTRPLPLSEVGDKSAIRAGFSLSLLRIRAPPMGSFDAFLRAFLHGEASRNVS